MKQIKAIVRPALLEILRRKLRANLMVERVRHTAATGRLGDGLVWITEVNAMWRLSSVADSSNV